MIYRVTGDKDKIGSWQDVADILNELLGTEYTESKFRKQRQAFDKMLAANQSKYADSAAQLQEIEDQKRELERLKIQYRDERQAWQKQNYTDARVGQKLDYLGEKLEGQGRINFPAYNVPEIKSDNDLLVQISDLHIGQKFSSQWGNYDSQITEERMRRYFLEIIKIKELHCSQNCYVLLQGDCISGSIHKNIQLTNRENVIDQIKIAIDLISSVCHALTKYFNNVYFYNVSGNHTRMDRKDDALHDERLDDLIGWDIGKSLSHIENFHSMLSENLDSGITRIKIRGKDYIGVHGDMDDFSKNGISNLCMMLGFKPEAILFGHLHHCSYDEEMGVKMIRSGGFAGCGDDYTIEKRLMGRPSQMVTVCSDKGVVCCYPVGLD